MSLITVGAIGEFGETHMQHSVAATLDVSSFFVGGAVHEYIPFKNRLYP